MTVVISKISKVIAWENWHHFQWDEYEATKQYLEQLDLIIQVGNNIYHICNICNI